MLARAILIVLFFAPALAVAQQEPTDPVAREHYDRGMAAYKAGQFDSASREFELAYAAEPMPRLLIPWGQAERFAGRCSRALRLFRMFLPEATSTAQVDFTRGLIDECERELRARDTTAPEPEPEPEPKAEEPPPIRPWYKDPLGGALAASGVVGVAVGIGFVGAAGSKKDNAPRDNLGVYLDELETATTYRRIGAFSLSLGVALVATGIIRYGIIRNRESTPIVAGTDGRTVMIGAQF